MGAAGCAWATLVVNYLLLLLTFLMLRTQSLYKPYFLWRPVEVPDWAQLGHFLRMGVPAGLSYLVEVTSFTLMAVFVARLGTIASASHQVAASVATVLYMIPLSIAIASSARVSFWLGAGEAERAQRVVVLALKLTGAYAIFLAFGILLARSMLPGWYSDSFGSEDGLRVSASSWTKARCHGQLSLASCWLEQWRRGWSFSV